MTALQLRRLAATLPPVHRLQMTGDAWMQAEGLTALRAMRPEEVDLQWADWLGHEQRLSQLASPKLRTLRLLNHRGEDYRLSRACLTGLASLRELHLDGQFELVDDDSFADVSRLHTLRLTFEVTTLTPLARLLRLRDLCAFCENVMDLAPLTPLPLERLELKYGRQLTEVSALAALAPTLRELTLFAWCQLRDLSAVGELLALRRLSLRECHRVEDLSPLANLLALEGLDLHNCICVRDLSPLACLPALKVLDLTSCIEVTTLHPLRSMFTLVRLDLGGIRVPVLPGLIKHPTLRNSWVWARWARPMPPV